MSARVLDDDFTQCPHEASRATCGQPCGCDCGSCLRLTNPAINPARKRQDEAHAAAGIAPSPEVAPESTENANGPQIGAQGVEAIRARVAFTVCSTCRKRVSLDRPDRHVCSIDLPASRSAGDGDSLGAHDALVVLKELVSLKDGPRGADYETRKPDAWARARAVVWSPAAAATIPKGRLADFKRDLERTTKGRLAVVRDILASEPEPLTIADWAALAGSRAALAKSLADDTGSLLAALDESRAEVDRVAAEANWLADVAETNRAAHEHVTAERDSLAAVVASVRELADEWRKAEREADEYGPSSAYTGNDCAEMLTAALTPTTTETGDES